MMVRMNASKTRALVYKSLVAVGIGATLLLATACIRPEPTGQAAAAVSDIEQIRQDLVVNLYSTVRWRETMQALVASGVGGFLEVGPKKVLGRLLQDFTELQPLPPVGHVSDYLAPHVALAD